MSATIYNDLSEITVQLDGAVAIITLNRPDQLNSFTNRMKDSLVAACARLDDDDRVRVILLTGAPNRHNVFCAGADLSAGDFSSTARYSNGGKSGHNSAQNANEHRDGGGQTALAFARLRKPSICALNGSSVGIGMTMTLPFDIRVAWKDAKIGFVFAKRGIVPEATSSYFLPRLIGHSRALELFMTARVQPASAPSLDLLFSSLHPTPEATVAAGLALAHEIASTTSALSCALIKGLVWHGKESPEEQHLLDSRAMHVAGNSIDSKEGVASFKAKRPPQFAATVPASLSEISEVYPWWAVQDVSRVQSKL